LLHLTEPKLPVAARRWDSREGPSLTVGHVFSFERDAK